MAEELLEEFLADSNDAFNLNLVRAGEEVFDEPFHPSFTYSIFGEDEKIFGYSDLELNLTFRAHDLQPSLDIKYEKKWQPIGETKAMDIKDILKDFLPADVLNGKAGKADGADSNWTPPGKLLHKYTQHGRQFEIWCAGLTDPTAKEILQSMQILIPFYIEGGTVQELDDEPWTMERWKLFLLYETTPLEDSSSAPPYTFAGFSTSYRLWVFPSADILARTNNTSFASEDGKPKPAEKDPETHLYRNNYSPLDAPSRERISQFLIIPPYQGQAHGSHLYNVMMDLFLADNNVFEVTVEEPNEAFDDLRDWCDLARLRRNSDFAALNIADSVPAEALRPDAHTPDLLPQDTIEKLHRTSKISPRQFARLVEMHTLSQIPARHRTAARISRKHKAADANDRRYYFWRHFVKERLYNHNRDQLMQIDESERVEKVEQALGSVETDYDRLLEVAERRAANGEGASAEGARTPAKRKKAVVEDDDDEDDEEETPKRTKVAV